MICSQRELAYSIESISSPACLSKTGDQKGNTALHWAVVGRLAVRDVLYLLQSGFFINQQNEFGETPLFLSVTTNNYQMAETLLSYGADPNISTFDGKTPLILAIGKGNKQMATLLLHFGASVNLADDEDDTPLHWAVRENDQELIKLLVENYHADFNAKNIDNETPVNLAEDLEDEKLVIFLKELVNNVVYRMQM
eukprot:TRINITY_DN2020_c0_g1_i1.p1 TRINITY_DN2020_c0_g1~~TRINITY_DN2020_c0_g1_i1.p1  ORF type:complete len:196 (-),score=27.90 TRINITY_DN2020_c0_g1_i1:86-673(-)